MLAFLKEWQTLVAGALAVGGGLFIWHQTQVNVRLERDRRRAFFEAARATLPLVLSELTGWVDMTIGQIRSIFPKVRGSSVPRSARDMDWAVLPDGLITEIRQLIEFCDQPTLRAYLAELLRNIQVARARLEGIRPSRNPNLIVIKTDLDNHLFDWIDVRLRVDSLWGYARGETNAPPSEPDWDRLPTQLTILSLDDNQHTRLCERVAKVMERKAKGKPKRPEVPA